MWFEEMRLDNEEVNINGVAAHARLPCVFGTPYIRFLLGGGRRRCRIVSRCGGQFARSSCVFTFHKALGVMHGCMRRDGKRGR